jgi:predicted transcriptional regulator
VGPPSALLDEELKYSHFRLFVGCLIVGDNMRPGDRYKDTGDSLLLKAFGSTPKLRIIDIFLTNPYFDFDKEELTRELGMSKQTVYKNFKDLEELGVVRVSRKIGRATMYRINRDYPLMKTLNESVNEASFQIAQQERKQKIPIAATE